ncbi:MAG: hypothetical protein JNN08_19205, partial [Bryobacterales bacterium]|nr:hypothetical protein [Bryobacterales bacterium]
MFLRAWFRPPRRWLVLFLLITFVPSALLVWFGWRSLQQDSALALQQVQERREQAADLIVAGLDQTLAGVEMALNDRTKLSRLEGAVVVVCSRERIGVFPGNGLLYYPIAPPSPEAPASLFAAAEELEFRRADHGAAAAALRTLSRSPDPAIRAGALIRLARNLRKSGQSEAALSAYAHAAGIRDAVVTGVPADLLAQWARCDLLERENRNAELAQEARALASYLLDGRWRITRATYEFHSEEVRRWLGPDVAMRPPPETVALSKTVEWLWSQWQSRPMRGREAVGIDGLRMTILSRHDPSALTALVAAPGYVEQQWVGKLAPLLDRQGVRVTLHDPAARVAGPHMSRRAAGETGLPWTLAVESIGTQNELDRIEARRRFWLAALALLAALVIAGTYFIGRAVARELAVARLQSDFVSAVSHEFRTPLTTLRQLTEILNDGRITNEERRRTYYQALARQTERLHRLVESLLDFGRMEAGTSPYRPEALDACAFVRSVVGEFETEAASRGYHVELAIDGAGATLAADREALANALWNLLDNAVKYSPECRTVWVDLKREVHRLAIRVRDQGLGIPAGEQKEIFRRFVRGEAARTANIKGTGIGLAMVHHIVKAHG